MQGLESEFQLKKQFVVLSRRLFYSIGHSFDFTCKISLGVSNILQSMVDARQHSILVHRILRLPIECCFCVTEGYLLSICSIPFFSSIFGVWLFLSFSNYLFDGKYFERLVPMGDIFIILAADLFFVWMVLFWDGVGELSL